MSGPHNAQQPTGCESAGNCALGFGDQTEVPSPLLDLCDPEQLELPDQSFSFCTSWGLEGAVITHECAAWESDTLTPFLLLDFDGDGDFDLLDLATFQNSFEPAPNDIQSDALLVSVECCMPQGDELALGLCLSGPAVVYAPAECESSASCILGFSEPLGPGDRLFRLCDAGRPELPDLDDSFCTSWQADQDQAAHFCRAATASGVNLFAVFDDDGDGDLDLKDFAGFQVDFQLAP